MSEMLVRFWGTRGSIPTPGRSTEKYGGNTTCLEVSCGETIIVLDAGSGIRQLGNAWLAEFTGETIRADLLFTHLHWDHIQGFPFFAPAYFKGNTFTIWGAERKDGGVRELLSGQMSGSYFPIPITAMQAEMLFRSTAEEFTLGPVRVRTMELPHPGGCLGYRLEFGDSVMVLATDCELDLIAQNREELSQRFDAPRQYPPELLSFFAGANMLVIDGQYTDEEYQKKKGWGHNSMTTLVDLCVQARPDMLVLFHHDPGSSDDKVTEMVTEMAKRLEKREVKDTLVLAARERMKMRVCKPIRPLEIPE
jgi:phosphoribosyl 1,2-cyclic phosphodiesterase